MLGAGFSEGRLRRLLLHDPLIQDLQDLLDLNDLQDLHDLQSQSEAVAFLYSSRNFSKGAAKVFVLRLIFTTR